MRPGTGDDVQHDDAASGEATGRAGSTEGADGDATTAPSGSPARTPSTARPAPGSPRAGSSKPRKPPRTAAERSAAAKKAAATRAANARARAEAAAAAAAAADAAAPDAPAPDAAAEGAVSDATEATAHETEPTAGSVETTGAASSAAVPPTAGTVTGAATETDVDAGSDAGGDGRDDAVEDDAVEAVDGAGTTGAAPTVAEESSVAGAAEHEAAEGRGRAGAPGPEDHAGAGADEDAETPGGPTAADGPRVAGAVTPASSGGGALAARLAGVLRTAWGRTTAGAGARRPAPASGERDRVRASPDAVTDADAVGEVGSGAEVDAPVEVDPPAGVDAPVEVDAPLEEDAAAEAVAGETPADAPAPADVPAGEDVRVDGAEAPVVLRLSGLVKRYGSTTAVDGLDLEVRAGTFYGIVGPNGAGKTTTLSMVTGLLRPDEGTVTVLGADVWADPGAAKRSLGVLPDRLRLFDRLTGAQLLYYSATLRGLDGATARKRSADLATAFGLQDALGRLVSDYSVGMTKKIALAAAIIHSPRVLVLDEPFESVDPVSAATVTDVLRRYVSGGGTVLLSSHSMDLVERTCDNVAVVVDGHVLASGTVDDVREGRSLEQRFVELAGGRAVTEGMEWLQNFSD